MENTIYAPPESNVDVPAGPDTAYYVVAPIKFFLLSLLTMNLYIIYWFYRNWRTVKQRTGESMWPPMRGIFYIFFTHSLFSRVNERIESEGKSFDWQPSALATIVVVLTILSNVLDRLAWESIGSPATDLISVALVPIVPLLMLKAQRAVNLASDDLEARTNSRLTPVNWIWMVFGALLWLLVLFGVLIMLVEPELYAE
ncbi:MAG: hypothetical protein AAFX56_06230 [Pseudomonadota bacterium]